MNCFPQSGRGARSLGCVFALMALLMVLDSCVSNPMRGTSAAGVSRFWVTLRLRPQLQAAAAFTDYAARGQFVMDELRRTAAASQVPVISLLQQRKAKFEPFWIANVIWVEGDEETRKMLGGLAEVESIEPDQAITLDALVTPVAAAQPATLRVEENLRRVRAPEVWDRGITGEGVVVGVLDSGFAQHPAISHRYRGFWEDVTNVGRCASPCDLNGHGTHVTGTIVGRAGEEAIGAAPGAEFIACRAFDHMGAGTMSGVLTCLQWFMEPGNDPANRPNIVNMSFETTTGGSVLGGALGNLQAAGILPVAAAGNAGGCATMIYPAAVPDALAVGALTADPTTNVVTHYTSLGPRPKPDLMAPGEAVRSSWLNSGYRTMSGTSMAAPAVSGVAALVMSANPRWMHDPAGVAQLLKSTANQDVLPSRTCPNSSFGGLVDAEAAVVEALR